jgi:integrase/recombinase XerD
VLRRILKISDLKINRQITSSQFLHLAESFKIWLETLGYKHETVKLNHRNIQEFMAHLETQEIDKLKDFENKHTHQFLEYLQHRPNQNKGGSLKAGFINKYVTALRLFGKYLQQSGKATISIKPELLKTKETATYLSKIEIKQLYKAAADEINPYNLRDVAMLSIYYGCGLRASEGAALDVNDLLFEKSLVYVRKGKNYKERYVPMSKQVKSDLQNYLVNQREIILNGGNSQALFLSRNGKRLAVHSIYQRLQWIKQQTNDEALKKKSFGLHILRHSIATHLLQDGMKLELISRFLGHKSLETTQKYTHLVNGTV